MHQIARGIFYDDTYLGVTLGGLVYSQGTILIDAPLRAEDSRSWRSALTNQRAGSGRLLVNLDAHPDRTLGARALDCTVVTHQKAAQVFRNRPTIFKGQAIETGSEWEAYPDAVGLRWANPDVTFTSTMSLYWGGPEVILQHRPGPAAGAAWVVIPNEKVVFVGDLVTLDQPPFLAFADMNEWITNLDALLTEFKEYTVVSGRGGPAPAKAIRAQQQFLKSVVKHTDRLARRNAAPEETEEAVSSLMAELSLNVDAEMLEKYTHRLRYGLAQYYIRRFRPSSSIEQPEAEEEEQ
jgi:glyoxylase-like metal-dependent hydrolase (beta-lactamase superfamily II)